VDDFTRECVAIEVDRSLPGARVVRVLERLQATHGLPETIVVDNGPEFAGRALDAWGLCRRCDLALHSAQEKSRERRRGPTAQAPGADTGLAFLAAHAYHTAERPEG
jgi:hypothetical protein